MTTGELYNGWPNRSTWALVCWLHGSKYCYLRDTAIATWIAAQIKFNPSGKALAAMTEKLKRDVTANAAAIRPEHLDKPLVEALEEIDWGAIADHWLVLGNGYWRRERQGRPNVWPRPRELAPTTVTTISSVRKLN